MEETDQYERDRIAKADALRALGVDPYGKQVDRRERECWTVAVNLAWSCRKQALIDGKLTIEPNFDYSPESGPPGAGAGRIVLRRVMGNLHFLTIRDYTGDIQVALNKKKLSEDHWKIAKLLDLGDLIYFHGVCAPTKTGEPTVWAVSITVGAKSVAPPPAKYEGLVDVEQRYRKRYVDLWSNPEVMKTAQLRASIISSLRHSLSHRDYIEVETPILQTIPGGAAARPFYTHHNALDIDLSLRVAPELYLKRLLVGGMPRVYEIGRNFRNEGLSPRHNPEFTALELYEAYADHVQMADLVEDVICHAATSSHRMPKLGFSRPWRMVKMVDLVKEFCAKQERMFYADGSPMLEPSMHDPESLHRFYEAHVEPTLVEPTFVTHLPASVVPLAKHDGHGYALAWELIVNGQEIGCGYTEQNDPAEQQKVLEAQLKRAIIAAGPDANSGVAAMEDNKIDRDFLEALHVGMPPAGGVGIGIDRLVMWLTGAKSIRDVILFPTMRPNAEG